MSAHLLTLDTSRPRSAAVPLGSNSATGRGRTRSQRRTLGGDVGLSSSERKRYSRSRPAPAAEPTVRALLRILYSPSRPSNMFPEIRAGKGRIERLSRTRHRARNRKRNRRRIPTSLRGVKWIIQEPSIRHRPWAHAVAMLSARLPTMGSGRRPGPTFASLGRGPPLSRAGR
jgi:hypothetical protein